MARLDTAALERDLASSRASLQSAQAELQRVAAQEEVDRLDTQGSVAGARDAVATAEQTLAEAQRALNTAQQLFDRGAASQNELTQGRRTRSLRRKGSSSKRPSPCRAPRRAKPPFRSSPPPDAAAARRRSPSCRRPSPTRNRPSEDAVLRAPFAGTVATIGFDVGDEVGGGVSSGRRRAKAACAWWMSRALLVTANFDENRASELQPGQPAAITPDADADALGSDATVRRVGSVADRTNNTAQLEVELDFEGDVASRASLRRHHPPRLHGNGAGHSQQRGGRPARTARSRLGRGRGKLRLQNHRDRNRGRHRRRHGRTRQP